VAWTLRLTTATLLAGHAACGAIVHKSLLRHQYSILWPQAPADLVTWVGLFEFGLAAAVLWRPVRPLLIAICAWKLATESLFLVAGSPVWELVERFGSYTAPLALALLPSLSPKRPLPSPSPALA